MKSKAIVLHVRKYGDDALIVDVLTEKAGCVGMMVRISRSRRAAIRHSLFQPLALLELEWRERNSDALVRPQAVASAFPYSSLPFHPHKSAIALYLAEFLFHAVRHEPDTETLFQYVEKSLQWLDACEEGFANFHLVFLLYLTQFLGFRPEARTYHPNCWFDLRSSVFCSSQPWHPDFLKPEDAALVPKLLRMKYSNMRFFRFNGAERSRLLEQIEHYYQLHVAGFPDTGSLEIFRSLF